VEKQGFVKSLERQTLAPMFSEFFLEQGVNERRYGAATADDYQHANQQ
jgi:hypothetical protein